MKSNHEEYKLIKELVKQGELSSDLLNKFKELRLEPLWHQILILLGETDQFKNLLSSNNEKEVNILAGELEENVLMKSKKDFIINPGRRLIKAIEFEAISSIDAKTKARQNDIQWDNLSKRMQKIKEKEDSLIYIKSQYNEPEKTGGVSPEKHDDDKYRKHIEYLEKRLAEIRKESDSKKSSQGSNHLSQKGSIYDKKISQSTDHSRKNNQRRTHQIAAKNKFKTKYIAYAIILASLPLAWKYVSQAVLFWNTENDPCKKYIMSRYQKTLCIDADLAELRQRIELKLTASELSYFDRYALKTCASTDRFRYSANPKAYSLSKINCFKSTMSGALSNDLW